MDEILNKMIVKCCAILHIKLKKTMIDGIIQFLKFGFIGITNTMLSYVLNVLVLFIMIPIRVSWDYIVGNTIAFLLSVLWSFYWNNRFVFTVEEGKSRSVGKTLIKTYISYGFTGIILNNILSGVWINFFDISKYIAPLINLFISVPLNFIINKMWAFRIEK